MCGIVGYLGSQDAVSVLMNGLKTLEYRGYDSAGVAYLNEGILEVRKKMGRIAVLDEYLGTQQWHTQIGIGHTRWATHGRPSDRNAHPHFDCTHKFAVVHNGIIENFAELRERLQANGHRFVSETDTEVLAHLVEEAYRGNLRLALRDALQQVRGSYTVVLLSEHHPDRIVASRKDNPLVAGIGDGEYFVASDIPALLPYTRKIYLLNAGEIVELTPDGINIVDFQDRPVHKEIFHVNWDAQAAERGGYPHFMLKEICEQPLAIKNTLSSRLTPDGSGIQLSEIGLTPEQIRNFSKVAIVACGTAYHAGMVGKYVFEKLARIPVEVDLASEFRYRDPLIDPKTLVVIVSQSGETADTLAALREARKRGCHVLAVTNVVGSSVAREADDVIHTWAGPEIAVASTKAYTTQVLVMYLLGMLFARERGKITTEQESEIVAALLQLPEQIDQILDQKERIEELAQQYHNCQDVFFLGRGLDYAVALEGALKLKEISYIHAEAYAAGELKHGTLALIVEGVPVVALATQDELLEKLISNVKEVKAREGTVIGLCLGKQELVDSTCDHVIRLPEAPSFVAPLLSVVPLQLFAYYMAAARGCDIDKPRN
ncbi:MAG: glutamine--fructose-6-phosphate transaminase (isomerizing), partial [Thermacetogeniaceae bacterium]